jgi:hypothetical protein
MSDHTDHQAIHGYNPSWDKQREKQEEAAAEFYDEADAEETREWLDEQEDDNDT